MRKITWECGEGVRKNKKNARKKSCQKKKKRDDSGGCSVLCFGSYTHIAFGYLCEYIHMRNCFTCFTISAAVPTG